MDFKGDSALVRMITVAKLITQTKATATAANDAPNNYCSFADEFSKFADLRRRTILFRGYQTNPTKRRNKPKTNANVTVTTPSPAPGPT